MYENIASCENHGSDLEESVVKGAFREASFVAVHLCQCGRVMDRDMIRRNTNEIAMFAMLLLDRLGALGAATLHCKPDWRNLGCDRARKCFERR